MEYVITPQRSGSVSLSSDLFFFLKIWPSLIPRSKREIRPRLNRSQTQERDMAQSRSQT